MSRRTLYRLGLLGTAAAWLVLECVAAFDGDPRSEPLTELVVGFAPWWVTIPLVTALAAWLPGHFIDAYRKGRKQSG